MFSSLKNYSNTNCSSLDISVKLCKLLIKYENINYPIKKITKIKNLAVLLEGYISPNPTKIIKKLFLLIFRIITCKYTGYDAPN